MKKRLVILLVLAALLSGCIDRAPSNPVEKIVYTPIAWALHALNPGDTYWPNQDPKQLVRLYWEVWQEER